MQKSQSGILQRTMLAAYAAPAFSQALIHGPMGSVIQGVYAKQFGLSLQSIAFALLISGIADSASHPLIGYSSDRFSARFGSRKPWLIAGAMIVVVACWFLYAPTPPVTTAYFLIWLLLAYLGWAIFQIPYVAWMAEITNKYDERTRLAAWQATLTYLGTAAFFGIPFLPFFATSEFTAESLRWTAIVVATAAPTLTAIAVLFVPNGVAPETRQSQSVQNTVRDLMRNKPLLVFVLVFALVGLGSGISYGVLFFYFDSYMRQGRALAGLFLLTLPAGAVAVPVWGYLCRRFGKQQAWAAGSVSAGVGLLLFALIQPGPHANLWLGAVLLWIVVSYTVTAVAAPAVLADVVDYGRLRFGFDNAGTYFSIYMLLYKAVPNVAGGIGIALVAAFGFDPKLAQQTPMGIVGLSVVFYVLPALMLWVSALLIWWFPINARRQQIIVRYLRRRADRISAIGNMAIIE